MSWAYARIRTHVRRRWLLVVTVLAAACAALAAAVHRRRLQERLDALHRRRFRKHVEVIYDEAGFEKPPDDSDDADSFAGWMREFRHYIQWRGESYRGDALYVNARRVFLAFFTPPGVACLKFLNARFPKVSRFMFKRTANLSMRWIVDCDIVDDPHDPNAQRVDECQFRKQLGEKACVHYCKIPTERFMREECGTAITLRPGKGHSCRFVLDGDGGDAAAASKATNLKLHNLEW
jgi:hypothetical protein